MGSFTWNFVEWQSRTLSSKLVAEDGFRWSRSRSEDSIKDQHYINIFQHCINIFQHCINSFLTSEMFAPQGDWQIHSQMSLRKILLCLNESLSLSPLKYFSDSLRPCKNNKNKSNFFGKIIMHTIFSWAMLALASDASEPYLSL